MRGCLRRTAVLSLDESRPQVVAVALLAACATAAAALAVVVAAVTIAVAAIAAITAIAAIAVTVVAAIAITVAAITAAAATATVVTAGMRRCEIGEGQGPIACNRRHDRGESDRTHGNRMAKEPAKRSSHLSLSDLVFWGTARARRNGRSPMRERRRSVLPDPVHIYG
jgi:hypothetical protein